MRLAKISYNGNTFIVAELPSDDFCDLSSIAGDDARKIMCNEAALAKAKELIAACAVGNQNFISKDKPHVLLAPIGGYQVDKVIGIGNNYTDIVEKNPSVTKPPEPPVFTKFGGTIVGPGVGIAKDEKFVVEMDYEVELGIVIGKTVPRYTSRDDVDQYIGGFTVMGDISARQVQNRSNILGKAIDGYCPLGPVIVTTDEMSVEKAMNTGVRSRINGEERQNNNTKNMIFNVREIVSFLSQFWTLQPGDCICTGTPNGVACYNHPPNFMNIGDKMELEIDGIGILANPIVDPITPADDFHWQRPK